MVKIREATQMDVPALHRIYNIYTAPNSTECWRSEVATLEEIDSWITGNGKYCVLCAMTDKRAVGFASLSDLTSDHGYKLVEVSIYLDHHAMGKGIGGKLIKALEQYAVENGYRSILAAVDAENAASLSLFMKSGYMESGFFRNAGLLGESNWRDLHMLTKQLV